MAKDYETGPVRRVSEVSAGAKGLRSETFEEQNEYQREMFLAKEGRHYSEGAMVLSMPPPDDSVPGFWGS